MAQYATFSGRAHRKEFWLFVLFSLVLTIPVRFVGVNTFGFDNEPLTAIYFLGMLVPGLAVTVRRLHDMGESGWLLLLLLMPGIGEVALFGMCCMRSQQTANKWGHVPK